MPSDRRRAVSHVTSEVQVQRLPDQFEHSFEPLWREPQGQFASGKAGKERPLSVFDAKLAQEYRAARALCEDHVENILRSKTAQQFNLGLQGFVCSLDFGISFEVDRFEVYARERMETKQRTRFDVELEWRERAYGRERGLDVPIASNERAQDALRKIEEQREVLVRQYRIKR